MSRVEVAAPQEEQIPIAGESAPWVTGTTLGHALIAQPFAMQELAALEERVQTAWPVQLAFG